MPRLDDQAWHGASIYEQSLAGRDGDLGGRCCSASTRTPRGGGRRFGRLGAFRSTRVARSSDDLPLHTCGTTSIDRQYRLSYVGVGFGAFSTYKTATRRLDRGWGWLKVHMDMPQKRELASGRYMHNAAEITSRRVALLRWLDLS